MLFSDILLPLLTVASVGVSAKPMHGKKSTWLSRDFDHARRAAQPPIEARAPKPRTSKKGKRLVKKKRGGYCQVPVNANGTVTTSAIGDNNWSTPTSTVVSASASAASSASAVSSAAASPSASSAGWDLVESVAGSNFFDSWWFWQWDDPTHGVVDYVDGSTAWNEGLISINSAGNAIMKVDTTNNVNGLRKAVRIHSNKVWTGGMVIMDALHMPHGCGVWPAWWSNGPNWPNGGEIDILEGVNEFTENQVSLHTGDGCTMPSNLNNGQTGQLTTGNYDSYNCASYATSNQGCGVRQVNDQTSYGSGFNGVGGGVYALKWDKSGISSWWFPRANIPQDIKDEVPNPANWGTPAADFPSDSCDPYKYFYDHFNIFTNTFCGDWAGADGVWNYAGYAGQSQSCAALTGYSTCSDYILNNGNALTEAYWEVASVKYYNSTTYV